MVQFDKEHRAVHYPPDRRFRIWIRPSILIGIGTAILSAVAAAWIEVAVSGKPRVAAIPQIYPNNFAGPHGFPVWVRYCHFFNFLFVMMLIRSGLSILMDHPRLYFNDGCTPGSEWIRFTPLSVPHDRLWTAKDDARYISPLVGTPGYRHTIGIARVWHFIDVHGFIVTGMLWGASLAEIIDRKFRAALAYLLLLAGFSFFGIIHSVTPEGNMYLPWKLPAPASSAPYQFSSAYLALAVLIFALSFTSEGREVPGASARHR